MDPIFGDSDSGGVFYTGPDRSTAGQQQRNRDINSNLRKIEDRMDRLTLACHSMWELLRDHTSLTEEDLQEKMLEVDLRDGNQDGKIGAQVMICEHCGRNTNSHRSSCLFCGEPVKKSSEFL